MNTAIELGLGGIVINENSITSDLHEPITSDDYSPEYDGAIDAIESLILAHHCAGIDVTSPEYLEGLKTALDAIGNNID